MLVEVKIRGVGWVLVAQTCNPSCLGSRDWEDQGSKPAWTKGSQDPISTNSWEQWHVPVPNYAGGGHGEGHGSRPARTKSF
jgi:hypothetical protein